MLYRSADCRVLYSMSLREFKNSVVKENARQAVMPGFWPRDPCDCPPDEDITVQLHQQSNSLHHLHVTGNCQYKTQSYLVTCRSETIECWPLVCMEEGNHSGELENCDRHGNAQEEYAMRRAVDCIGFNVPPNTL